MLSAGAQRLARIPIAELVALLEPCFCAAEQVADRWVELAVKAKGISGQGSASEEMVSGPVAVLRCLFLLRQTLSNLRDKGSVTFPGKLTHSADGRIQVPLLPVWELYDHLAFRELSSFARMQEGVTEQNLHGDRVKRLLAPEQNSPGVALVLGAGNVSSIPVTDALSKIFWDRKAVLLKLNPVNDYLEDCFRTAFRSVIDAGFLRIITGDGRVGQEACHDPRIHEVHITGSHHTHRAIVWGSNSAEQEQNLIQNKPVLDKPITSELGNVSPWIVVPGNYSKRELSSQAMHVAGSIVNNASFNCIATKMIVTSRSWPQRETFLQMLKQILSEIPMRQAYYPGAADRFRQFAPQSDCPSGEQPELPWTLVENVTPANDPLYFEEESFVCVCAETALETSDPLEFMSRAAELCNEQMFGTLSASVTVPAAVTRNEKVAWNRFLADLRYGAVGINQWAAIAFALMTPPWGGYPGATLADPQSGLGDVHNCYLLDRVEKSILSGPLVSFPKPIWLPHHRASVQAAKSLMRLYAQPSFWKLIPLGWHALRG
ncbi:MAG: aldehyde dehydrogenase family protein [Planctomycetaceae bacterium]|nr:aldehyde dehydrogenase family protein [Planctomycetaceae bacterium]